MALEADHLGLCLKDSRAALEALGGQLSATAKQVDLLQERLESLADASDQQDCSVVSAWRHQAAADLFLGKKEPEADFLPAASQNSTRPESASTGPGEAWPFMRAQLLQFQEEQQAYIRTLHHEHEQRMGHFLKRVNFTLRNHATNSNASMTSVGTSPSNAGTRCGPQKHVASRLPHSSEHDSVVDGHVVDSDVSGNEGESVAPGTTVTPLSPRIMLKRSRGSMDSQDFANWVDSAQLQNLPSFQSDRLTQRSERPMLPRSLGERIASSCRRIAKTYHAIREWDRRKVIDVVSGFLILVSIIWMAIDVDTSMKNLVTGGESPAWIWVGEGIITGAFVVEICARLCVYKRDFFTWPELPWNILNIAIVATDMLDLFMRVWSPSILRSLRVTRFVRILRVIRALRVVRELRVMLASIFCCFISLSWALILLFFVMLLSSLILMQTLMLQLDDSSIHRQSPELLKYYGSLGASMLSICMSITGGVNWSDLMTPLETLSVWYQPAFALFMAFVTVGILNVLAAIFVESTHRIAEVDSDLAISEQYDREESHCKMIRQFFQEADFNGDGVITKDEFELKMQDDRCTAQLRTLDLDGWTVRGMFRLLNIGEEGVEVEALVYGLMRLRGSAKAIDMAMILYENKRSSTRLREKVTKVEKRVHDLQYHMTRLSRVEEDGDELQDADGERGKEECEHEEVEGQPGEAEGPKGLKEQTGREPDEAAEVCENVTARPREIMRI